MNLPFNRHPLNPLIVVFSFRILLAKSLSFRESLLFLLRRRWPSSCFGPKNSNYISPYACRSHRPCTARTNLLANRSRFQSNVFNENFRIDKSTHKSLERLVNAPKVKCYSTSVNLQQFWNSSVHRSEYNEIYDRLSWSKSFVVHTRLGQFCCQLDNDGRKVKVRQRTFNKHFMLVA